MNQEVQNNKIKKVKGKKNTFDTVLNIFAWLSFFLAVVLAVAVFLSSFSGTDNGRQIFGHKMLIVESDSMSKSEISQQEPIFFNKGDLIFIKQLDSIKEIKEGDVITFVSYNPESKGKTISHKVRSILTNASGNIIGFETYGIHTGVSDKAIVDPSTIIGKYVGKSETLGQLFCFFKTPAGYFTSILIPCVLLIIFFSIKVGKLLTKREAHRMYYDEFEKLRNRISELEKNKDGVFMLNNLEQAQIEANENQPSEAQESGARNITGQTSAVIENAPVQPQQGCVQQPVYVPTFNDKALELTINSLNRTIDTLTRTIENLVSTVEKPVDTLANTVQTLATATTKPTVVERVIEKQVTYQPAVETPVARQPQKATNIVQEITPAQQEIAVTQVAENLVDEKVEQEIEEKELSPFDKLNTSREKIPFNKKLLSLDSEIKNYFSEVHNELVSYKKVSYRISFRGISYKVGRKPVAKMAVRGKTLKLYLALDVNAYPNSVFFQEDSSSIKRYEEVPFTVKIKSNRGKNNAVKLITSLAENNGIVKNEQFKGENILKALKTFK